MNYVDLPENIENTLNEFSEEKSLEKSQIDILENSNGSFEHSIMNLLCQKYSFKKLFIVDSLLQPILSLNLNNHYPNIVEYVFNNIMFLL